ncbi:glycerophosphodiester phosphodiesterase family protein [Tsuneonella mangrovi]|uniref:glycerophosphodiester phosphodiesterase family protein n=1 Tax=Tsuneonella mangrovi TaxID=1982042 RepID=UPI000BA1F848|nr:glycerophosphodiester phosphodiesterase family protein [Tsuneonella mangrovi]
MRIFLALAALAMTVPATAHAQLIIAHRGASGERPEHTLAAYEKAIDDGADYIEADLVVSKDGVLVARHENDLTDTTDVADHPEFADRRKAKEIDGKLINGWFAEDFTLAELETLHAKERLPGLRPINAQFDGLYQVPTLAQIVRLVRAKQAETGRKVGLYLELKHPTFLLQEQGIDTVDLLLLDLKKYGVTADYPVFIECFEVGALQRLKQRSRFKLVQLVEREGGPADEPGMSYANMATPSGLADIAKYADAIGPDFRELVDPDGKPTALVADAHAAGLKIHGWTLRKENAFLPPALQIGTNPAAKGNYAAAFKAIAAAGIDGVFTDDPGLAVKARAAK